MDQRFKDIAFLNVLFDSKVDFKHIPLEETKGVYFCDCDDELFNKVLSEKLQPIAWMIFQRMQDQVRFPADVVEVFAAKMESIKPTEPTQLVPSAYATFIGLFISLHHLDRNFSTVYSSLSIKGSQIEFVTKEKEFHLPEGSYHIKGYDRDELNPLFRNVLGLPKNILVIDGTKLNDILRFWRRIFPHPKPPISVRDRMSKLYITRFCPQTSLGFKLPIEVYNSDFRIQMIKEYIEVKDPVDGYYTFNVENAEAYRILYSLNVRVINLLGYILSKRFKNMDISLIKYLLTFVEI